MRFQVATGRVVIDDQNISFGIAHAMPAGSESRRAFVIASISSLDERSDLDITQAARSNCLRSAADRDAEVSTTAGTSAVAAEALMRSRNVKPSIPGILRSSRTISGFCSMSRSNPSFPFGEIER